MNMEDQLILSVCQKIEPRQKLVKCEGIEKEMVICYVNLLPLQCTTVATVMDP